MKMITRFSRTQIHWLCTVALAALAGFYFVSCDSSSTSGGAGLSKFFPGGGNPGSNVGKLVWIPAGTFQMGSPDSEPYRISIETQHSVTLTKGFYMMDKQVTQAQYKAVIGNNPSYFKGDNLPVEMVSWYDAIVFCNKLSMKEGLTPAYKIKNSTNPDSWGAVPSSSDTDWDAVEIVTGSTGYRLPTEAQWEYACRAGTTTPFNTGDNITTSQANYNGFPYNGNPAGENRGKTTPVGSFSPNAWGLYDMHGNLLEWCWDWYVDYGGTGSQTDPTGAVSGTHHMLRGGSWIKDGLYLRSACRYVNEPYSRSSEYGFRLVRP